MIKIWIRDLAISDHRAIHCELNLRKPVFAKKMVHFRKLRSINLNCFSEDIRTSPLFNQPSSDLQSPVFRYNSVLLSLLDKHAPLKSRCVTVRLSAAWYTPEVAEQKRKRCGLERKWLKTDLEVDRENYVYQCRVVTNLIANLKSFCIMHQLFGKMLMIGRCCSRLVKNYFRRKQCGITRLHRTMIYWQTVLRDLFSKK